MCVGGMCVGGMCVCGRDITCLNYSPTHQVRCMVGVLFLIGSGLEDVTVHTVTPTTSELLLLLPSSPPATHPCSLSIKCWILKSVQGNLSMEWPQVSLGIGMGMASGKPWYWYGNGFR